MARIRTIKPEFPQSESMGRVSREARLTFVLLWTLADDAGRLRGNSRMLASLLFPYDADAPGLIDGWLEELVKEGCITRYLADGGAYVEINKWLEHQKIDKPSKSKIPASSEASRTVANIREESSEDLRTKDQGPKDQDPERRDDFDSRYGQVVERAEGILQNPKCLVWGRIDAWLKQGADPERDIFPVLEAHKGKWRSGNLAYFDQPIADSIATRTKPLPSGTSLPSKTAKGQYQAPSPDDEAQRHARYAQMIKKQMSPGLNFTSSDRFKMIKAGLITMEDCERAGCAA